MIYRRNRAAARLERILRAGSNHARAAHPTPRRFGFGDGDFAAQNLRDTRYLMHLLL